MLDVFVVVAAGNDGLVVMDNSGTHRFASSPGDTGSQVSVGSTIASQLRTGLVDVNKDGIDDASTAASVAKARR